jgi:hypothetical protein
MPALFHSIAVNEIGCFTVLIGISVANMGIAKFFHGCGNILVGYFSPTKGAGDGNRSRRDCEGKLTVL